MTAIAPERERQSLTAPAAPVRAHPNAVLAVIGAGAVAVLTLWWHNTPSLHGLGDWLTNAGRYTVSLVVAHALLITWGYSVAAHQSVVGETKTLLLSYPDVLMATVAGLLLVGVGISSARAARRRLRYETWYYLHFYTYLAVAL